MYYAVANGQHPGIYDSWSEASEQVSGYPGAVFKGFKTRGEAESYLQEHIAQTEVSDSRIGTLTDEQRSVLDFLLKGQNVFLTGGGGVGKSYLLSVVYTEFPGMMRRLLNDNKLPRIQLCALTGCAALLLGHQAKTLHSWAGIGLGKGTAGELYMKIRKNRKSMRNWLMTDLLVIDEVSMLTAELLDKLNDIGKKIRGNRNPFGGMQIMLVGDFFQLPPVNRSDEPTRFAFESNAWKEGIHVCVELTQIQRQKDERFHTILNEARMGTLSKESCSVLKGLEGRDWRGLAIRPTLLFPRRAEVELINESNLRALSGPRRTYTAKLVYDGKLPKGFLESDEGFQKALTKFDTDSSYTTSLELIQESQVMLIANVEPDAGLVNGSRGVLVGFCPSTDLPIVEFMNGVRKPIGHHHWPIEEYEFCSRSQIPLRLSWAITIHKCISSDTLLCLPNKGLVRIQDLESSNQENGSIIYPTDLTVSGLHESKQIIEVYKGFVEEGIVLESAFGYEITGSYRHPLLIYDQQNHVFEWKKIPDISIGDCIVLKKGSNVEGSYYQLNNITFNTSYCNKHITIPVCIDETFGYLMGIFLGDGSINKKTYRFDFLSMDFDIIERCTKILQNLFGICLKIRQYKNRKTSTWRIFFHSRQLVELFEAIGYKFENANKKEIPYCILQSPLSVQKSVIQGLYDTDGGVSRTCINFTTTSHIMGKQIQQIMLNMGLLVSKHTLHEEDTSKNWSKAYRLNMSGKSAVQFNQLIGFYCQRKKIQSESLFIKKNSIRKDSKSQSFELPNGHVLIKRLRDEMYNGTKRLNTTNQISVCGRKLLSALVCGTQKLRCDSIDVLIQSIKNIEIYPTGKLLKFIHDSGIIIDQIVSSRTISNVQMYDIGVSPLNGSGYLPDGHDFIANGFVNHNCQGSSLDSALVDIGSGNFEFGQAYVALSRVRSLEALYVHDFDPVSFRAHPNVKAFYQSMNRSQMDPGEQEEIRRKASAPLDNDVKSVMAEPSRIIKGVNVVKEPGSAFS